MPPTVEQCAEHVLMARQIFASICSVPAPDRKPRFPRQSSTELYEGFKASGCKPPPAAPLIVW
jgi:hypothetical protein